MGAAGLLQAVAALMTTCTRRLQRAARRVGKASPSSSSPSPLASPLRAVVPWRKAFSLPAAAKGKAVGRKGAGAGAGAGGGGDETVGLWRKEILMGERCQPLDFSGVIYYDADGRRLAHPPPPRSPMRSPLPISPRLAAANARAF